LSADPHAATPQPRALDLERFDPLTLLVRLQHRERNATRLWERLSERVAWFPNPANILQHQEVLAEREHLRRQIAELSAQHDRDLNRTSAH